MSSSLNKERFNALAQQWDAKPERVEGAMSFVDSILNDINKDIKNFSLLDYGSGSGLVSFGFASKVENIVGLDNSEEMVKVYNNKADKIELDNISSRVHDINKDDLEEESFDLVVTNMTMHHINDIDMFVTKLSTSLKDDGFLYIADLVTEDGTFHSDNTGVEHFGFEIETVEKSFIDAGLKDVSVEIMNTINKPHKSFDIFIARGRK